MSNENNDNNTNYYQPEANSQPESPAGNTNYYQPENNPQPETNGGNFYAPPVQPSIPPKKKKKWPVVAAVAGVVVVVGAAAATYFTLQKPSFDNPSEAVISCVNQLGDQFSSKALRTSSLEEKLDSEAMMNSLTEKGMDVGLTLTLEDSDMDELAMFKGVSAGFTYQNDPSNGAYRFDVDASIMGIGGDIGLYMDSDMLAVVSDEFLSDTYLSADMDDIVDLIEESGSISSDEMNYLISTMEQSTKLSQGLTEYLEYCAKELTDSMKAFVKACDIEDADTDSLSIGEEDFDCHSYEISVTTEAFKGFLEDYGSYLGEYDYESNPYFSFLADAYALEGDEIDLNDVISETLTALPDAIDEDSDETLDFTVYLSEKAQLLGIDFNLEENDIEMSLRFGGKNPGQDIYFTASADTGYSDFAMDISLVNSVEDDTETAAFDASATIDDEELFAITCQNNYNTEDDSFETAIVANVDADGEALVLNISGEGSYEDIEKGKGYTIVYDDLTVELDGDAADSLDLPLSTISCSAEMSCQVLEDGLDKPDGTGYDVLNLTEKDVTKILKVLKKSQTFSYILQAVPEDTIEEFMNEIVNGSL